MTKHASDRKALSAAKLTDEIGYRRVIYQALKHGTVHLGSVWFGCTPMEFALICATTPLDPNVPLLEL